MSQELNVKATAKTPARPKGWAKWRFLTLLGAVFVSLAGLRVITGQDMLTDAGTVRTTLVFAVPIALAALGGLWAERAGIINIGLEGMMILGTWFGAYFAWTTGDPWIGMLAGVVAGMAGGLIHAVATVTFAVDHIVSGVAINILMLGAMRYLSILTYEDVPQAGAAQSPVTPDFPTLSLPVLPDLLQPVAASGIFVIGDLAAFVVGLTTNMSALTLVALLMIPLTYVLLWRTTFGLRLRSVGENPDAAESLGVAVYRLKYTAVIISGGLAGMGGAFLSLVASNIYQEGQTGGRGYIGLAAMIFGNWRPGGLAMGAGLFGYTDALQVRGGGAAIHALLLLFVAALLAWAVWRARSSLIGRVGAVSAVTGALVYAFVSAGPLAAFSGTLLPASGLLLLIGLVLALIGTRNPDTPWLATVAVGLVTVGALAYWLGSFTALPTTDTTTVFVAGSVLGVIAALVSMWGHKERATALAVVTAGTAALLLFWYFGTDSLPRELSTYSPHIATLLVLSLASQKLRAPAGIGQQWRASRS
ncbi:ABC transporter permease [Nocardiopsis sp. HNM0947]|uniref:ABC transporter permease n=1 Tax=Nocardiopsis coralli TaxID=2772213 RepID=A0ABR9P589_9ACTN|nr:ABC transporter permease [Nocardiopsis coralli]MBE2998995.1 ABC transporter permease [Nocardiopsis coralli]